MELIDGCLLISKVAFEVEGFTEFFT